MRSHAVSPLLHRVLVAVIGTGTALAAEACSGATGAGEPLCESPTAYDLTDRVRLRAKLDFLAQSYNLPGSTGYYYGAKAGVPCGGASTPATCQAQLAAAHGDPNGLRRPNENVYGYYVATRGDEIVVADTATELAALVGPADEPHVAAFLALAPSSPVDCSAIKVNSLSNATIVNHTRSLGCIGGGTETRTYVVTRSGEVTLESTERNEPEGGCMVEGRLHEGQPRIAYEGDDAGSLLARAAFYESGSVGSFVRLARELRAHGAPEALVARAIAAARDEVRHARATRRLARLRGATVVRPPRAPRAVRPLEEVLRENAVEGCVRETYAALVALHQAERARDASVRSAMATIAEDEIGHAALAWSIAEWAESRLDAPAQARIGAARAAAIAELAATASGRDAETASEEARLALGLPDAAMTRALAAELAAGLAAGLAA